MTTGAQQALRRIMELHANTTRFALACNLSSKIIEPIQSRCAILRFTRLSAEQLLARLLAVCREENVKYTPEGLDALIFTADGDMRQAINNMQSAVSGFGFVTPDAVFKVCDQPHPALVESIIEDCLMGQVEQAQRGLDELWELGYAAVDVVTTFFRVVKGMPFGKISEATQLELIKEIGFAHMRVLEGLATKLQLSGMLVSLCQLNAE